MQMSIPGGRLPWSAPGEPSRRVGLALLCLCLIAFFGLQYDNFFTSSNALATALNLSSIAIAGVGTAMLLISGNVDLSIGAQWAFGTMVVGHVAHSTQGVFLPILVGLLVGFGMGLVNGLLVKWLAISPLIVTLGTSLIYGGLAFVVSKGNPIFGFSPDFTTIGASRPGGIPMPVIVSALLFLLGGFLLVGTRFGLRIYAIGANAEAASRNGVNVGRTVVKLFAINGVLIGIISILTTSRFDNASPQLGAMFALDVLTAVILGGVAFSGGQGHPIGVLIGVATIGILDTGLIFVGVESWYQQITRGALLVLALVADQLLSHRGSRRHGTDDGPGSVDNLESATPATPGNIRSEVALSCTRLSKNYGPVHAVVDASFDVRHGEIVCLVGDNGAGKSTVVKMISGIIAPSGGAISVDGNSVTQNSVAEFRDAGVHAVYQDLALCTNLSVAHNLVLGEEPLHSNPLLRLLGTRDDRLASARAAERLRRLGSTFTDTNRLVRDLSGGQRQSVAIARALRADTSVMILDEPTAALGVRQTARVLDAVRAVARAGTGVVLITHDVETVLEIADRIVVMRNGVVVHDGPAKDLTHMRLLHLMAGLSDDGTAPTRTTHTAETVQTGQPSTWDNSWW